MGKREAKEDGIRFYYDPNRRARGHHGTYVFCIPCDICGEMMETLTYGRSRKYVCAKCQDRRAHHNKEVEKAWFDVIEEKGEARFNKALDRIERQVKDFSKYEKAVRLARTRQDRYGSVPEAMVAVELLHLGYSIIPQQKVDRYRVDFYIPKQKIVIEVDGSVFHRDEYRGDREARIQMALGLDATIIHVPAELIAKDIKKLKKVIDSRMNNRNHGT